MQCYPPRRAWFSAALLLSLAGVVGAPARAQASLRDDYRQFIFANRTIGSLNPQVVKRQTVRSVRIERIQITTESGQDAVALIMRPLKEKRYPVVLVQHFAGGNKEDPMVLGFMSGFVTRGYMAVSIDARYHGERGRPVNFEQAVRRALQNGNEHPWLVDTVFDLTRTVDYLVTRPDVDTARIGLFGISQGGLEAWMAAAADERFSAVVSALGVTRIQYIVEAANQPAAAAFRRAFLPALQDLATELGEPAVNQRVIEEAFNRLLPGFTDQFDAINLVPLIAPRPLLILNHGRDEIIPVKGAEEVFQVTQARYAQLGVADRVRIRISPRLRHVGVDPFELLEIFRWMDRWLKGPAPRAAAR